MSNTSKTNSKKSVTKRATSKPATTHTEKIAFIGLGLAVTGITGYFAYQYFKTKGEEKNQTSNTSETPTEIPTTQATFTLKQKETTPSQNTNSSPNSFQDLKNLFTKTKPKPKGEFPLKKGSKGDKVKGIQQILIAFYGKSILPRYGADGHFGTELHNALKKLNYPTTISETLYNVIIAGQEKTSIAQQLYASINQYDFQTTLSLLKKLQNKTDYTKVNNEFKEFRLHGNVRQTLVNGALNSFSDEGQKASIRLEFMRMGLKYNGQKWSLDGLPSQRIITIKPTKVWIDGIQSMDVPQNMVLGKAIAEKLDFTLFENDKKYFLVRTDCIAPH